MTSDPNSWKEWKPEEYTGDAAAFRKGYDVNAAGRHESETQYRAFRHYAESGPSRKKALTAEYAEVADNTICKWSEKYDWDTRCVHYDKKQLAMTLGQSNKMERQRHRQAIEDYRRSNEDQARLMMGVSQDLMGIIQKRIEKADAEDEDIPLGLLSGLMRAAANISDSGRQAWATSLGVGQLMEVVDQELEEVQVEILEEEADEAYDIPLDE